MGKEATATFIGHKECYGVQAEDVRREVEKLIASGVTDFLNGGMGGFDWMCARVVFDLKKSYPQIRNYLVIPYLTFNIAEPKYFDDIIYPEGFEKYHFKAAIPARNRYLVERCIRFVLCDSRLGRRCADTRTRSEKWADNNQFRREERWER